MILLMLAYDQTVPAPAPAPDLRFAISGTLALGPPLSGTLILTPL